MPEPRDPVGWAARRLSASGVESPRLEAQLLLALALGISRTAVTAGLFGPLDGERQRRFHDLVTARCSHVPLAYLRGTQEFYSLDFEVGTAVLIPRSETEMLVEFALETFAAAANMPEARLHSSKTSADLEARANDSGSSIRRDRWTLADVGTGSGCIAISALFHLPSARGVAVDISRAALEVAGRNADRHVVTERLRFVQGDLLSGAAAGSFDLILSNPPYIPSGDLEGLQAEVRDSEPRLALDGGPDGLAPYRVLAVSARRCLKRGGRLAVEVGQGQSEDVASLFESAGMSGIEVRKDLAGIERLVSARCVNA